MLRTHRLRREHRRQRREIARLVQLVAVAIERGFEKVIGYMDARLKVRKR